jgi:hypothetical protein
VLYFEVEELKRMTPDALDRKVRQMHEALGALRCEDLSSVRVERDTNYVRVDFSQGTNPSGLANIASSLIANIACLKDHLKLWCQQNGKTHDPENLINTNRDVAIVHDLWNIDKHGELNRPPRSGVHPKLQNLARGLRIQTGATPGSVGMFTMNLQGGEMRIHNDGGSTALVITGEIVDENGRALGDFETVCERAASAWEQELIKAGVAIPPRQDSDQ